MTTSTSTMTQNRTNKLGQYLTFFLSDGLFGLDIVTVREIIQFSKVTEVPLMPAFVKGVINLRGAVVPVIDLLARLGKDSSGSTKKSCIVIFDAVRDGERIELGLLVDAVSAVVDINDSDIEPPPHFGSAVKRDFIKGMGKLGDDFVIILEPEKAFDLDEMLELCQQNNDSVRA
jgi:purine-binding chemotaxis protein CheW